MANVPIVDPTKIGVPETGRKAEENPNPGGCKKHCHYPTIRTRRYSAGNDVVEGCPCMESRKECEFEWDQSGRGLCRNCHQGNSLTVKASDCTLDF